MCLWPRDIETFARFTQGGTIVEVADAWLKSLFQKELNPFRNGGLRSPQIVRPIAHRARICNLKSGGVEESRILSFVRPGDSKPQ